VIYDFTDENVLKQPLVPYGTVTNVAPPKVLVRIPHLSRDQEKSFAFNPLPYMHPSQEHIWPLGFPLSELSVQPPIANATVTFASVPSASVGVVQTVCEGDPNFDAVFRLTRNLPVYFRKDPKRSLRLLVPKNKYSPYNAQATVHMYSAFWGLLLPWSVPQRVTAIWRSYFTQRIMHEIGLVLLYDPPIARHIGSPQDYLEDLQAEGDLYAKTSKLLEFLGNWSCENEFLPARLEQLTIDLYEHDFLGIEDVHGTQEWLIALMDIGYKFPSISDGGSDSVQPIVSSEPSEEDQAFLASPRFNVDENHFSYIEYTESLGKNGSYDLFQDWSKTLQTSRRISDHGLLKIVLMNKDEWPYLREWLGYHGSLVGFENIYIVDGSDGLKTINYLAHVRDHYGVNAIFSSANLNEVEAQLSRVGREISKASDFIIKMDTDEFLVTNSKHSECKYSHKTRNHVTDCTLTPYGVMETIQGLKRLSNGERLRIGHMQISISSSAACVDNNRTYDIKSSYLGGITPGGGYKAISDSRTFRGLDLGGHTNLIVKPFGKELEDIYTDLGILHFHYKCWKSEIENCRKVLVSHNIISKEDSDEMAKIKLLERHGLSNNRSIVCRTSVINGTSWHKQLFYMKYLFECITEGEWYNASLNPYQNPAFQFEFLSSTGKAAHSRNPDFSKFVSDSGAAMDDDTRQCSMSLSKLIDDSGARMDDDTRPCSM